MNGIDLLFCLDNSEPLPDLTRGKIKSLEKTFFFLNLISTFHFLLVEHKGGSKTHVGELTFPAKSFRSSFIFWFIFLWIFFLDKKFFLKNIVRFLFLNKMSNFIDSLWFPKLYFFYFPIDVLMSGCFPIWRIRLIEFRNFFLYV
jgi:hypothetical protein